jgi:hypothetical protein
MIVSFRLGTFTAPGDTQGERNGRNRMTRPQAFGAVDTPATGPDLKAVPAASRHQSGKL